jgi:hypothetical protein
LRLAERVPEPVWDQKGSQEPVPPARRQVAESGKPTVTFTTEKPALPGRWREGGKEGSREGDR